MKKIFTITLILSLISVSSPSLYGQIGGARVVSSTSYDANKNHTLKVKKDVERAVRKTIQSYSRYGKLTGKSGKVEQYAIDEFKNVFVSNAQIVADYTKELKKIGASYYASEVFNSAKNTGLDYYFEQGTLESLELDADNIYVATVNIIKVMKTEIINGRSKGIAPKFIELEIKLDIQPDDLSRALIFEIDGTDINKSIPIKIPKLRITPVINYGINQFDPFHSSILELNKESKTTNIGFALSTDYNFINDGLIGLGVEVMGTQFNFSTNYKELNSEPDFKGADAPLDFKIPFTLIQEIEEGGIDNFSAKTVSIFLGPVLNMRLTNKIAASVSGKVGFMRTQYELISDINKASFIIKNTVQTTVGEETVKINSSNVMVKDSGECDLGCLGLGEGNVIVRQDIENKTGLGIKFSGNVFYQITNKLAFNLGLSSVSDLNSFRSDEYVYQKAIGFVKDNDSLTKDILVDFTETIKNSFIGVNIGFSYSL